MAAMDRRQSPTFGLRFVDGLIKPLLFGDFNDRSDDFHFLCPQ
jgi:hypothetical protein